MGLAAALGLGILTFLTTVNALYYSFFAFRELPIVQPRGKVAILVRTLNERDYVELCLRSLDNQPILQRYPRNFEKVVIDGGSTDGTIEIARALGWEVVVFPRSKGWGKVSSTDYYIRYMTSADIVVLCDSDTFFPRMWLQNVLYHFRNPRVVAVRTPKLYDVPAVSFIALPKVLLEVNMPCGNCAFVRRAYIESGGFEVWCEGSKLQYWGEEVVLYKRLRRLGEVVFEPTPVFARLPTRKWIRT